MQKFTGKIGVERSKNYILWQYDSVQEFADEALANPDKQTSNRPKQYDYNATDSFQEAYDLLVGGWKAARVQVDGYMDELREHLSDILGQETERYHDLIGYEPDIDRFVAGELECMWDDRVIELPKQGKVFRLLVDCSMSWDNTEEEILQRGAVLCCLVEAFVMLGFELELWVEQTIMPSWGGDGGGFDYASELVRINKAGEPLDINTMMFPIGHPDWLRRIIFSVEEFHEETRTKFGCHSGGGYGLVVRKAHHAERVNASAVVSLDGNRAMTSDPVKWVLDQLRFQGVWDG